MDPVKHVPIIARYIVIFFLLLRLLVKLPIIFRGLYPLITSIIIIFLIVGFFTKFKHIFLFAGAMFLFHLLDALQAIIRFGSNNFALGVIANNGFLLVVCLIGYYFERKQHKKKKH